MNYSITGEPAPSQLDQKRKQLMQSLLSGGPGAQRLLGPKAGQQGFMRGFTANDSPMAATPGVPFNPFLAQIQRGVGGLNAPTAGIRQQINDLTGGQGASPVFSGSGAQPGVQAPQPGQGAVPDQGPAANAGDLSTLMSQAGAQFAPAGSYGLFDYDPTQVQPAPQPAQGIPYLGRRLGANVAT